MTYRRPSEDANTPRDALLEAAFTQFVQQAQAPPGFAARVRARTSGPHAARQPRIYLAFRDNAREYELRNLLLSLRATIVAGPSEQGVYLVQVPPAGLISQGRDTAEEWAPKKSWCLFLEELRAHPAVRLAEPVTAPEETP